MMHKTDKQAKENLSEGISQPLERRRSRKAKATDNNGCCLVDNTDEFKHILLKYCLRKQRDGRDFAVSAFSVLEYQSLLKNFGQTATDQLLHMVQAIVLSNIRDSDRLCNLDNGSFLLLLPDSDGKTATRVLDRLSQSVACGKTQYHKRSLHASLSLKTVATDSKNNDAQALLNEIGYEIANDGKLGLFANLVARDVPVLTADLSTWLQRYDELEPIEAPCLKSNIKVRKFAALDTWRRNISVELVLIDRWPDNADHSLATSFLSRARVLQALNHPGVLAVDDFHESECGTRAISYQLPASLRLGQYLSDHGIKQSTVYSLVEQILNILICLQGLIPPVVPNQINLDNFSLGQDGQLILIDYFLPYLLPDVDGAAEGSSAQSGTVFVEIFSSLLKDLMALNFHLPSEQTLSRLACELEQTPLLKSLNTLYKIRSYLHENLPAEILSKDS